MKTNIIQEDLEKIFSSGDKTKVKHLGLVMEKMLYHEEDPEKAYHKVFWKLKEIINGKVLTKELASDAVKNLLPFGEVWTMDATQQHMMRHKIECDLCEFYYISNMLYNRHESLREETGDVLCKATLEWLHDRNTKKDKVYEFIKHISLYGRK